jgi:CBS domain-containing protein
VVDELVGARVGAVPVLDDERRPVGIVSTVDALAALSRRRSASLMLPPG